MAERAFATLFNTQTIAVDFDPMLKDPAIHDPWDDDVMTPGVVRDIFYSGVTYTASGEQIKASSHISPEQGKALARLVLAEPMIKQTLEVGCAQGVSSVIICDAMKFRTKARHTILDPFQERDWKGAGLSALKRAGLTNFDFIPEPSEFALPKLLEAGRRFDMIFIDGLHTFDQALVDSFYATRLLNVGGFLVLDDTDMPPIDKLRSYLRNYDCYEVYKEVYAFSQIRWKSILQAMGGWFMWLTPNIRHYIPRKYRGLLIKPRMVIFKKVREDQRRWNWYKPF